MQHKLAIVILTFNEELNLDKCLKSLQKLNAPIYVIDSYSTDKTEEIARKYNATFIQHKFLTHTLQWKFGLENLPKDVEWILGLDADQTLTAELQEEISTLLTTNDTSDIVGYYIRRRNYFLNTWIRFGGYQNRYLLKLFRKDAVYLDESELMDHHFYVNGKTSRLKSDLIENNVKENLEFWKAKHHKYAELQAKEEFEKLLVNRGSLFGNQDERRLFLKSLWNRMPLFIRPLLYFIYRYFFLFGFLDGRTGSKFHYLQAYWYRRLVDENIYKLKSKSKKYYQELFFVSRFVIFLCLFYYFNLFFIGITAEGGDFYSAFLDKHLNYIRYLRESIIYCSSLLLNLCNYETIRLPYHIKIINGVRVGVGYDCLGYGLMSMHIALALSYPFKIKLRRKYLFFGLLAIYTINVIRIASVGIVYTEYRNIQIDHHFIFNVIAYILIFAMMVYAIKTNTKHENTRT
jgi:exosortase/archaeosortase family protein